MADDPSAVLGEIGKRNEERIRFFAYTEYTVEHDVAEGDVRRLLAALDAVLKAASDWKRYAAEGDAQDECANEVRKVIACELTGKGGGA